MDSRGALPLSLPPPTLPSTFHFSRTHSLCVVPVVVLIARSETTYLSPPTPILTTHPQSEATRKPRSPNAVNATRTITPTAPSRSRSKRKHQQHQQQHRQQRKKKEMMPQPRPAASASGNAPASRRPRRARTARMKMRTRTRRTAVEMMKRAYHHGPLPPPRQVVMLLLLLLLQARCTWKGSRTKPRKTTSFVSFKTRAVER